ncbi:hypothetical protein KIW84_044220 [Lathyrus oleraceus]|uniref:Uncharacterized protein n=1 Tax=Pisum sativum TaxID=3888 RepID=A0A9D4XH95_PEA|nr:hypothetical protein KIW84_044220 [Pisum sativum]
MSDLHRRILPPAFLSENPKEAGFCLWMLHPDQQSSQLPSDVESILLQQVLNLTPKQLSSLPPEQQQQTSLIVIHLHGLILSCSSEFPEVAKILSDLKLLLTENGQLTLTSSLINDLFSWTLLLLVLTQLYYASLLSLFVILVIVLAFLVKLVSVFVSSWVYQMPHMEGLTLALLMNTKGTMPLIILYTAMDRLELESQPFVVMLLACWLMTAISGPVLAMITKSLNTGKVLGSQRKTMQGTRPDSSLRVLACVHSKHDAEAIIDLLKASSPSVRSPIQMLAVELIKMTNRPTSSLIIKDARKPSFRSNSSKLESLKQDNGDNLGSFDNLSQAIFADKLRVVSQYSSMHKDIINLYTRRHYPKLYSTGYKQEAYNMQLFWITMLDTVWQSLVLFYTPLFTYKDSSIDIWSVGSLWIIAVVILVNVHLADHHGQATLMKSVLKPG